MITNKSSNELYNTVRYKTRFLNFLGTRLPAVPNVLSFNSTRYSAAGLGNGPGDPEIFDPGFQNPFFDTEKMLILNPEPGPNLKFSPKTDSDQEFLVLAGSGFSTGYNKIFKLKC